MRIIWGMAIACGLLTPLAAAAETTGAKVYREMMNGKIVFDSYPDGSLKRGEEGEVGFRIKLNKDGKLHSCAIVRSSGYRGLDEATCDMLARYAYFTPVKNEKGRPVASTHSGTVVWTLPQGLAKGPPPPAALVNRAPTELADSEIICRRSPKMGSLYIRTKVCLSRRDWVRQTEGAQGETRRLQDPRPGNQGH